MTRPKTLVSEANRNADRVAEDLIRKYPGEKIKKKVLILKYELPYNQSYFVFELLRKKGFGMDSKFIMIPNINPNQHPDQSQASPPSGPV